MATSFLAVRTQPDTFTARRLKLPLAPAAMKAGRDWATAQVGKDYDHRFLWSDDAIYCSELVWKIYQHAGVELCKPRQFRDFHHDDPKVKKDIEQQFGSMDKLPREEKVVAPSDLLTSPITLQIRLWRAFFRAQPPTRTVRQLPQGRG